MRKKITESGAKAYQRADVEWRTKPYSDWHRTLSKDLLMLDVDFIEWRFRNGKLVAVGVTEVTRVDHGKAVNDRYLSAILKRYNERDLQGQATRMVADALGTKAYIVLFREDCSEFWVYNLTDQQGWHYFNPLGMKRFLQRL